MRQLLVLALALSACAASSPPTSTSTSTTTSTSTSAIAAVLDDWHDAAAHADEERYFGHFAPNAVFLGTDGSERWDLEAFRAYSHPHFAKGKAWSFHAVERHVTFAEGNQIAWFDEALETKNLGPSRGSGVVVLDPKTGRWTIAQYNLSVPIPNERFEDVKKIIAQPR